MSSTSSDSTVEYAFQELGESLENIPSSSTSDNKKPFSSSMASRTVSLLSKFRGCMLGSLVGDCLGAPFEGERHISKTVINQYFEKIYETNDNQKVVYKKYTDDTAMTRCVAQSLIEKKSFHAEDMARKFYREYYAQPRRGYGGSVVEVFAALKAQDGKDPFGPAKTAFSNRGSWGNGASMRVAPIALFCWGNEEEAVKMAKQASQITHAHKLGYNGAILQVCTQALVKNGRCELRQIYANATFLLATLLGLCLAVHTAINQDPKEGINTTEFVESLIERIKEIQNEEHCENGEAKCYVEKLTKVKDLLQEDFNEDHAVYYLGNGVAAFDSVPSSLYAFLKAVEDAVKYDENGFMKAVKYAISLGGDTDTIASMTGSIAGAYYGEEAIPRCVIPHCEDVETSLKQAEHLYDIVEK